MYIYIYTVYSTYNCAACIRHGWLTNHPQVAGFFSAPVEQRKRVQNHLSHQDFSPAVNNRARLQHVGYQSQMLHGAGR